MKIEKINDKQIRCTLTREDLVSREIKLSELAYGSEKAKALFQDMMQVAAQDFGFDAENTPLVIEAVPVSMDSIILIITKVDDPEELDSRFSRFSPESSSSTEGSFSIADLMDHMEGADDILGLIRRFAEAKNRALQAASESKSAAKEKTEQSKAPVSDDSIDVREFTRCYLFRSLDDAIRVAGIIGTSYEGPNSLFKDPDSGEYYLLIKKAETPAELFNKICNILTEYSFSCKYIPGLDAHLTEHTEIILDGNALQSLAQLA